MVPRCGLVYRRGPDTIRLYLFRDQLVEYLKIEYHKAYWIDTGQVPKTEMGRMN